MAKGSKGIVRKTDDLGRISIPKEMRQTAGIGKGDSVDIYFKDGVICVEPYISEKCVCCGAINKELTEVNEVHMCQKCIKKFEKTSKEAESLRW